MTSLKVVLPIVLVCLGSMLPRLSFSEISKEDEVCLSRAAQSVIQINGSYKNGSRVINTTGSGVQVSVNGIDYIFTANHVVLLPEITMRIGEEGGSTLAIDTHFIHRSTVHDFAAVPAPQTDVSSMSLSAGIKLDEEIPLWIIGFPDGKLEIKKSTFLRKVTLAVDGDRSQDAPKLETIPAVHGGNSGGALITCVDDTPVLMGIVVQKVLDAGGKPSSTFSTDIYTIKNLITSD